MTLADLLSEVANALTHLSYVMAGILGLLVVIVLYVRAINKKLEQ